MLKKGSLCISGSVRSRVTLTNIGNPTIGTPAVTFKSLIRRSSGVNWLMSVFASMISLNILLLSGSKPPNLSRVSVISISRGVARSAFFEKFEVSIKIGPVA